MLLSEIEVHVSKFAAEPLEEAVSSDVSEELSSVEVIDLIVS